MLVRREKIPRARRGIERTLNDQCSAFRLAMKATSMLSWNWKRLNALWMPFGRRQRFRP
jgi:hypothetical protein